MDVLIQFIAVVLVLYIFELTKSIASTLQGDTVPKENGMLTLNVFKYIEPIGFLLAFFYGGYGWGRPAPVSPRSYKNKKAGILITYTAPIIVSVLLALALNIAGVKLLEYALLKTSMGSVPAYFCMLPSYMAVYFLRLAVFNLIPIPPMCASEILKCFLSPNDAFRYGQNAPLAQMVFMFLWFFGIITPILDRIVQFMAQILL